jgi:hypothetical protein
VGFELRKEFFRLPELGNGQNHHTHSLEISRPLNRTFQAPPEDKMTNRVRWKYGASFLVLSLIASPAAFAAADNSGQETPSQAEPESKSYLPPWMQGQGGGEHASPPASPATPATGGTPGPATGATPGNGSAATSDDQAAKGQVRGASQGQRRRHRRWSDDDIIGGVVGFFGR